jgi:hypothetical protein
LLAAISTYEDSEETYRIEEPRKNYDSWGQTQSEEAEGEAGPSICSFFLPNLPI